MQVIEINKEANIKIEFNGSRTYFVTQMFDNGETEDCIFATGTERKAKNFVKRYLKSAGFV